MIINMKWPGYNSKVLIKFRCNIYRENVKHLFECFCEVAAPVDEKPAWILQRYPESYADEELLKSVPKFVYPCEFEK